MTSPDGAEVLRAAARLMRERAEVATEGPWYAVKGSAVFNPSVSTVPHVCADFLDQREWVAEAGPEDRLGEPDSEHIASWHPAVALAVADWLEWMSKAHDDGYLAGSHALVVARAYLGADR